MFTFTLAQTAYAWFEDGTENGASQISTLNAAFGREVNSDATAVLRVRLTESGGAAGAATDDYQLQYDLNASGSWTNVTTTSSVVKAFASTNLTDGGATTNRLGTASFVAGEVSEDGLVDDYTFAASSSTELVYTITFIAADLAHDDVITFRILYNGATFTYTVTPTAKVIKGSLVSNGVFDTATTGWTASNATLSVTTGRLRVTNSGAAVGLSYQEITGLTVGNTYRVEFDTFGGTGGSTLRAGISANSAAYFNNTTVAENQSADFVATQTNVFITARTNSATAGHASDYDNISLRDITPPSQSLTPPLFTNTQTFHAATVLALYALTAPLLTNSQTFHAATVASGAAPLTPSLFTNTQTFFAPTVANVGGSTQDIQPPLFTNTQTFHAATAASTYALTAGLLTNTQTFHAPTVTATYALTAPLLTNTQTFHAASVTAGPANTSPSLFTNNQTFFAPTVSGAGVTISPPLLTNTQTFFAPAVSVGAASLAPPLFTNSQTFHAATVSAGSVSIAPSLLTNSQTFFAPSVAPAAVNIAPPLLTNAQTFHAPTVTSSYVLAPPLFTDTQTFFAPLVAGGGTQDIQPPLFTNTNTFLIANIGHAEASSPPGIIFRHGEHDPIRTIKLNELTTATGAIGKRNRSELARFTSTNAAFLRESKREGMFTWVESDLSAFVAADTAQGIYVAPDASTGRAADGSGGAWVRTFDGPINIGWFGITEGDDPANGVANATAFEKMKELLAVRGYNYSVSGNARGLDALYCPPGTYWFDDHDGDDIAINLTEGTFFISGVAAARVGSGSGETAATVFKFPAGVTGIVTQHINTSGTTTKDGTTHVSAKGSMIENLSLVGGFTGTEGEYHGLLARTPTHLRHVQVSGFEGDGFRFIGDSGPSGGHAGTAGGSVDLSTLFMCSSESNRNGMFIDGADANVCQFDTINFKANRQWGLWESSYLGNVYSNLHFSDNGASPDNDGVNIGASVVTHGGNRYCCIVGQAAGASTNAPTGTTADNTWWAYMAAGGASSGIPAWFNGILVREGGSFHSDLINSKNVFINPYEEGNQGHPQLTGGDLVLNGQLTEVRGGAHVYTNSAQDLVLDAAIISTTGNLRTAGAAPHFGPSSGTAVNTSAFFNNTSTTTTISFRRFDSAGALQGTDATITVNSSLARINAAGSTGIQLQQGGTTRATVNAGGIDIAAGHTLEIGGTTVLSGKGAAVADASGGATVDTEARAQLNALLAQLRAINIIAT